MAWPRRVVTVLAVLALAGCKPTAPANVVLSKSTLEFGEVETGYGPFRLSLNVRNDGDVAAQLAGVHLDSPTGELVLERDAPASLEPGARAVLTVAWRPTVEGEVSATLVVDVADGPRTLAVHGRAVSLGATVRSDPGPGCGGGEGALAFGTVTHGAPVARRFTVEATGTGTLSLFRASVSPADAGFTVAGFVPTALAPGQTVELTVQYDPLLPGAQAGQVVVETNSLRTRRLEVPVCGTGLVSALCVSPAELSFGTLFAGAASTEVLTATSCGNLPVTLEAVELAPTSAPGFSLTRPTLPVALQPAQTASLPLTYTAATSLAARGEVVLRSSSSVTPTLQVAVGANLPPPCELGVSPTTLQLYKDSSWSRPVRLSNRGATPCLVQRLEITPAGADFMLERTLEFPVELRPHTSMELNVLYVPPPTATRPSSATLEVEVDFVRRVALKGDPRAPAGCHLVPATPYLDFGLMTPGAGAVAAWELRNVGAGPCELFGVSVDRPQFTAEVMSLTVEPLGLARVVVRHEGVPQGPVTATLTLLSNDVDEPQRDVPVVAGHVRCDPSCVCDGQTHTWWRHATEPVASSIEPRAQGERLFKETCDPLRCPLDRVAVELGRDAFACVPPPPDCGGDEVLDFVGDGWVCSACPLVVQYGGLFDGVRACATLPTVSCMSGQVPTFDAQAHAWSCVPTCNNGAYDRRNLPDGTLVCVPC